MIVPSNQSFVRSARNLFDAGEITVEQYGEILRRSVAVQPLPINRAYVSLEDFWFFEFGLDYMGGGL